MGERGWEGGGIGGSKGAGQPQRRAGSGGKPLIQADSASRSGRSRKPSIADFEWSPIHFLGHAESDKILPCSEVSSSAS